MRLGDFVESPWRRLGVLLAGWLALLAGIGMTSGHAFWKVLGARTLHQGLAQATGLCALADALFLVVALGRGKGGSSRIAQGFLAAIGIALSLAGYSWIRHMWISGIE